MAPTMRISGLRRRSPRLRSIDVTHTKKKKEVKGRPAKRLKKNPSPEDDVDGNSSTDEDESSAVSSTGTGTGTGIVIDVDTASFTAADTYDTDDSTSSDEESLPEVDICDFLPSDLLGKIFFGGYLDSYQVLRTTSCLNKKLRNVAATHVHMLDLRRCPLHPEDVSTLVTRFPSLKTLDLSDVEDFGEAHLTHLRPLKLEKLNLRGTDIDDAALTSFFKRTKNNKSNSNLLELDVSAVDEFQVDNITDIAVKQIVQHCPSLRVLKLAWHKNITNKSARLVAKLKHLHTLDINLTNIDANGCTHLSKIASLQNIDLSACPQLGDKGIVNLCKLNSPIKTVTYRFHRTITNKALNVLIQKAPNLEYLNIQHCDFTQDDAPNQFQTLTEKGVNVVADPPPIPDPEENYYEMDSSSEDEEEGDFHAY